MGLKDEFTATDFSQHETLGDTWTLEEGGGWTQMHTHGVAVARAHHCGDVLEDRLIVYSGLDANLLAVESVCVLELETAVWSELVFEQLGPRLDACAAAVQARLCGPFYLPLSGKEVRLCGETAHNGKRVVRNPGRWETALTALSTCYGL